ncbi:MAG: Efflux ABC transporter, permease protein [uncultured Corynebacteriales bacterium]|uniref:Transport permease protein n=1 Tax=uncultured Mycobacteriales bacterium TaxID=581187 RepID=A0A6J4JHK3_9ACTN|nr:MAG: Efflux ABC transporter, permease protein [uncultured Corynebacteriales bacterium]
MSVRDFATDTGIVLERELRPALRDPFSVVFSMVQPLVFLGLFAPLLTGLTGASTADSLRSFVPGILVMTCLIGCSMTGSALQLEMTTGSHERLLVSPLGRPAQLVGRALKEIVPVLVQALLIVLVTLPFGFRAAPAGLVVGLALLAVTAVGLGALSYALALAVREQEWAFWGVQQTVLFPLLLLAGVLLPLESGPGWMRAASVVNPLRHLVDAERALFAGDLLTGAVGRGALAAVVTGAVGVWVGTRAMHRAG